jgi:hypothetical protein
VAIDLEAGIAWWIAKNERVAAKAAARAAKSVFERARRVYVIMVAGSFTVDRCPDVRPSPVPAGVLTRLTPATRSGS